MEIHGIEGVCAFVMQVNELKDVRGIKAKACFVVEMKMKE